MQVTARDELMLEWLSTVRLTSMEGVRWALAGLAESGDPVSMRRAQQWVSRGVEAGLLGRELLTYHDGSIVWATHRAIGKNAPNFNQMTRHEIAVSVVSARYLAAGFSWERDRPAPSRNEHVADGVARRGDRVELVEVELTPKRAPRYRSIMDSHSWRLQREGVGRVVYFTNAESKRAIDTHADQYVFRDDRPRVVAAAVLDRRGRWIEGAGFPIDNEELSVPVPLPQLADGVDA